MGFGAKSRKSTETITSETARSPVLEEVFEWKSPWFGVNWLAKHRRTDVENRMGLKASPIGGITPIYLSSLHGLPGKDRAQVS